MTNEQFLKNLDVPAGRVDVILDTDTYNEIDDQFALSYMLKYSDRLNCMGITAAPFSNAKSTGPLDGMEKSYDEIMRLLPLCKREDLIPLVKKGSGSYLCDEKTAVESEACDFIAKKCLEYSPENPLYVIAIGAITNVASAIIKEPKMIENTVIVWLGCNALHIGNTAEFNLYQDIAAGRVVLSCGVPVVLLPCCGVVDIFHASKDDFERWFIGKNDLSTYLASAAIRDYEGFNPGKPWTKVIWDVTAIGWMINDGDRFMTSTLLDAPLPGYDGTFGKETCAHKIRYVTHIHRDTLFEDLAEKITK